MSLCLWVSILLFIDSDCSNGIESSFQIKTRKWREGGKQVESGETGGQRECRRLIATLGCVMDGWL